MVVTQRPVLQRTGRNGGQVHLLMSAWQSPFQHLNWLVEHCAVHRSRDATQRPLLHLTGDETGHGHCALERTQELSWHMNGMADGQIVSVHLVVLSTQLPLEQRTGV